MRAQPGVSWSAGHEATLLVLLVAGVSMLLLASRTRLPYQLLLVLGGLVLAVIPGAPSVEMPPEIVLVAFLPPLLYVGAYYTSLRDLRANLRPIGLLSVGLVLTTTVVVAVVAHEAIDGLTWSSAFILGAVVSPTDAIAITAMAQRFGLPRRIVVVLEGRACSTTRRRSSPTASRSRPPSPARSRSPAPACTSS